METELVVQILTIGGPVAAIAILNILMQNRLQMRWMDHVEKYTDKMEEVSRVLGEVNESLRRMNGK